MTRGITLVGISAVVAIVSTALVELSDSKVRRLPTGESMRIVGEGNKKCVQVWSGAPDNQCDVEGRQGCSGECNWDGICVMSGGLCWKCAPPLVNNRVWRCAGVPQACTEAIDTNVVACGNKHWGTCQSEFQECPPLVGCVGTCTYEPGPSLIPCNSIQVEGCIH